ncbi:glycosyltransferase [Rhizobium sp. FKY42]|uniref:glycosyltransferase n=1 Tax=Rhizobium sp. FKY42 TaxID=2562310 RepID=UPI0014852ABB|nr:glycosyltransferase [Rhizobium sp. FKY42]
MQIGLSMVVKNEQQRLDTCLSGIHDLFDEIVVVDTGSTDATVDILRKTYGAQVISVEPPKDDPYVITDARNVSLKNNQADWILVLDADECISREDVQTIRNAVSDGPDAYFVTWRNTRGSSVFDDYKLALFKNGLGLSFEGLVHSNPQRSARRAGIEAVSLPGVAIRHCLSHPNAGRTARQARLERYVAAYPNWWRYQWFLGYTHYCNGDFESAVPLLRDTCNSLCPDFPVECLNAHFVLADINARKGIKDKCSRIMRQAVSFYDAFRDDFEVRVNQSMLPWMEKAIDAIDRDNLQEVRSYEFAY